MSVQWTNHFLVKRSSYQRHWQSKGLSGQIFVTSVWSRRYMKEVVLTFRPVSNFNKAKPTASIPYFNDSYGHFDLKFFFFFNETLVLTRRRWPLSSYHPTRLWQHQQYYHSYSWEACDQETTPNSRGLWNNQTVALKWNCSWCWSYSSRLKKRRGICQR